MFGLNLQVITSIPRWGLSRQSRRCSIPPRFAASESSEKAESEPTGRTRPEGPAKRPATKVEKGSQKKKGKKTDQEDEGDADAEHDPIGGGHDDDDDDDDLHGSGAEGDPPSQSATRGSMKRPASAAKTNAKKPATKTRGASNRFQEILCCWKSFK